MNEKLIVAMMNELRMWLRYIAQVGRDADSGVEEREVWLCELGYVSFQSSVELGRIGDNGKGLKQEDGDFIMSSSGRDELVSLQPTSAKGILRPKVVCVPDEYSIFFD